MNFENAYCKGAIYTHDNHDMFVMGKITESVKDDTIYYIAANAPDYRATYTGSGLPYANPEQAFDNTPNRGSAKLLSNTFEVKLIFPNSYYKHLGTILIPPTLYVTYKTNDGETRKVDIKLSDGIPFRMLTYPMQFTRARVDASFYGNQELPVRSQEAILRSSSYPDVNKMPSNFWGFKPPL